MARPIPTIEDTKVRTTVSLSRKVVAAAEAYRAAHPELDFRDFSGVVSRALIDYFERHQPGLLADVIARIKSGRLEYEQSDEPARAVAEADALARKEQSKRRGAKAGSGGGRRR